MSTLSVQSSAQAFDDAPPNSNPRRRHYDWSRSVAVSVGRPGHPAFAPIEPGGSLVVLDGTRVTAVDGTTAFTVTLSALGAPRYRFSWVSGTNPGLRTNRSLSLSGVAVTVTENGDQTATFSVASGSLSVVQAGDEVLVPGPSTGDAATVFSPLNEGLWVAVAALSSTSVQLQRPAGEPFSAAAEVVTLASAAQLQAFTAAGVRPGDRVAVSAAFAQATRRTFTVDRASPGWFEVLSTSAIPAEVAKTPGATGMVFYSAAQAFLRVEADQELGVGLNGGSTDSIRVSPWRAGDPEQVGWVELCGPVWKVEVANKSSSVVNADVFVAAASAVVA